MGQPADFRKRAKPWSLRASSSTCRHHLGCEIALSLTCAMEGHHRSRITRAKFSFVRSSDPMLLAPLRAWTAHIMQLRPVGIENCARQGPQEPDLVHEGSIGRDHLRGCRGYDPVLDRLANLLEGAGLDLAHAFARHAEFVSQLIELAPL